MLGKIKKYSLTQLEKYDESRASHPSLQCLTVKSWVNIIAVALGAPPALKNKKTTWNVEEPWLYTLGKTRSTVKTPIKLIQIWGIFRSQNVVLMCGISCNSWKGVSLPLSLKTGTQYDGHYGCSACDVNINSSHDLAYSLQRKYKTLESWRQQIISGPAGKKGKLAPLQGFKRWGAEGWATSKQGEVLQKTKGWLAKGIVHNPWGNNKVSYPSSHKWCFSWITYPWEVWITVLWGLHCSMNHTTRATTSHHWHWCTHQMKGMFFHPAQ